MELIIKDTKSILTISDNVFNRTFNEALIHQVIVAYASGARQGTKAQKSRAAVTGSNKKPWRQKGTGRARAGSVKSPIWRSGGVTFVNKFQNFVHKVNKKMYRGALRSIFSELIRQERLILISDFLIEFPKTKLLLDKLKNMGLIGIDLIEKILIIVSDLENNLFLAARNLYAIQIFRVVEINPMNLINCDKVIITSSAIKKIEGVLI